MFICSIVARAGPSWSPGSLSMRGSITAARKAELQTQFPQLPLTSYGICISKGFGFALRREATKRLITVGNKENTVCSVQRMTFPYYRKKKKENLKIKIKKSVTGKVPAEPRLLEAARCVLTGCRAGAMWLFCGGGWVRSLGRLYPL